MLNFLFLVVSLMSFGTAIPVPMPDASIAAQRSDESFVSPYDRALTIAKISQTDVNSIDFVDLSVVLTTRTGDLFIVNRQAVSIDGDMLVLSMLNDADTGPGTVFESTYTDSTGHTHTVTTDCRRYETIKGCAQGHAEAIKALELVFPPRA